MAALMMQVRFCFSVQAAGSRTYTSPQISPVRTLLLFWILTTMSSLRNSLHRRNHKERGQLAHRSKLGILEKHKDYVLRAKDYHSKQDRLTRLKQKAADRNKDEFYFSMHKQKTEVCLAITLLLVV